MIPFNRPFFSEECIENIRATAINGMQSGDGEFSRKCVDLFREKYGFHHCLLTPSATHALEMMSMLLNLGPGDEVIIPSYTFVSTANAFAKYGVRVVCVDSLADNPNIDPDAVEAHVTDRTRAVCVVHYAGWGCQMEKIQEICRRHNLSLLEDAAQAVNSYYQGQPLGSFGDMAAFSFHETKNIGCGEGGMLVVNRQDLITRSEIIREKGTNRTQFHKGEVEKYQWVDIGSSYLLSDINAAYLLPQLQQIDEITRHRRELWYRYYDRLSLYLEDFEDPPFKINSRGVMGGSMPPGNYHIFYLLFNDREDLQQVKQHLHENGVMTTTHYVALHLSDYYKHHYPEIKCLNAEQYTERLLRLPLFHDLTVSQVDRIVDLIGGTWVPP